MTAIPKQKPYRDPHLLKMAKGNLCYLRVPSMEGHNPETVVACHSNFLEHGKGKSQKANDFFVVYGCYQCHSWLDQGSASKEKKKEAFWVGYKRQLAEWQRVVDQDVDYPRDQKSARKALNAFSEWVTENKWRFSEGDWQLEYVICPDCKELKKDSGWEGYTPNCPECEKRMLESINEYPKRKK